MFIQIMPLAALEFLQYVFNILGGINIVLNFCCLLCVARLTSPKFGYFISQGVILMATNVLINIVMIILKPVEAIVYGRLYTFYLSEFLPDYPCIYYFILECLQVQLVYFGIYVYIVMIVRYHRKHLVSHALLAAAVTEVIFLLIKAVRISLAGDASDKLATAAISRFLRHDYVIYALEDLKDCQIFLIVESVIHFGLLITTLFFSSYLYHFLKVATPDNVLSKKMFFNTRLRMNIRISVFIIHGSISFPFLARNIYHLSNPGLMSVTPFPYFVMTMVSTTSVPCIFLFSYYYTAISDRLYKRRVVAPNLSNAKHAKKQAWPTHVTQDSV